MSLTPRISVLISSYNNARFVAKKLAEIRAQTFFEEAEFLLIETASPEREREQFASFCSEHANCRLLVTDDRRTLYQAWNLGWNAASAPLLCYSNMDDAMHPRLLEEVVPAMERNSWDACSVLTAKQSMDEEWNDWSPERVGNLPLSTRPGPFTAWKKDLAARIGRFDERFLIAADKEFWHRIAKAELRVGLVSKILYLYTRNPESLSQHTRRSEHWQKEKSLLSEMNLEWPASLRWRIRWLRLCGALAPSRFTVPLPSAILASAK